MNKVYQEGRTMFRMKGIQGNEYTVSIVSRRLSRIVLRKSWREQWNMPIAELLPHCEISNFGIEIIGFSPGSGIHLARLIK